MTGLEERLGRAFEYVSFVAFLLSRKPKPHTAQEELIYFHVGVAMDELDKAIDLMNHIGTDNGPGEN